MIEKERERAILNPDKPALVSLLERHIFRGKNAAERTASLKSKLKLANDCRASHSRVAKFCSKFLKPYDKPFVKLTYQRCAGKILKVKKIAGAE